MSLPCILPSQMQNADDARSSPQDLLKTRGLDVLQDSELFRPEKGNRVPSHYSNTHSGSVIRHINGECACSVVSDSLRPRGLCSLPWNFPGTNTGVGCHFLLQGIFPTQGSNPSLLLGRQILYHCTTWEVLSTSV